MPADGLTPGRKMTYKLDMFFFQVPVPLYHLYYGSDDVFQNGWQDNEECYGTLSVNALAPGRSYCYFKNVIFNLALLIGIFKSSYDNVLRWLLQDLTDDKSTLVQIMAWCHKATRHYLNQCWPRSPMLYGVTRPQWVNILGTEWNGCHSTGNYSNWMRILSKENCCFSNFHQI